MNVLLWMFNLMFVFILFRCEYVLCGRLVFCIGLLCRILGCEWISV